MTATPICEGVAFSKAFNAFSQTLPEVSFIGVEASIKQYEKAINLSLKQLRDFKSKNVGNHGFLDAHILLLEDNMLKTEVVELIVNEHINASSAFTKVIDKYIELMRNSTDEYLKERYLDFLDIKTRVLQNINKMNISLANLDECILIIEELFPSLLINISKNVKGIIVKKGGFTSHSAILCRMLGIPYVICDIPSDFKGDIIIDNDTVYLNPTKELIDSYAKRKDNEEKIIKDLKDIKVYANIVNNADILNITDEFSGIGLYRTEFILMNSEYAFDYKKQAAVYEEALKAIGDRPITFRTFDLGGDKQVDYLPMLKKGIINYYTYPKLFENQIKALLLVSKKYPSQVKIMFPMIENFKQYQELKKKIVKLAREEGQKVPPIGMMLETQSALINLTEFKNVDFISVGTNDLTSELFNVSRDDVVLFDKLYDNLLEVLKKVINYCNNNNISLSVCGELISKKEFAKKSIEAGLKNISISSHFINNIYKAINEGDN